MDIEGMDFREALEHLAQKAGVTLPAFNTQASGERRRLYEINDLAARFFRAVLLQSPDAEHARKYADDRGIDGLTGDLFRIGYAPDSWETLKNALNAKDVTDDELIRAGLTAPSQRGTGSYDRFRGRLMFPISDVHGHIVGFTGRLLDANAKEAKYVNTPETVAFKKSAVLYGLDKAKGEIKSKDACVIVEGNMDVVSSHRVNITNVVCSSGTALTADQLRLISRFTKNLSIAFDADAAGINATLRGLDLARTEDFNIKIITLPPDAGKDPDDAIRKDPEIWKEAIASAVDIMDWVFRLAFKGRNLADPFQKREIAQQILPEIKRIADPIVRDHWLKKLANALETSEDALRDAIGRTRSAGGTPNYRTSGRQGSGTSRDPSDPSHTGHVASRTNGTRQRDLAERILAILLVNPTLRTRVPEILPRHLPDDLATLYSSGLERYDSARFSEVSRPEDDTFTPEQTIDHLVNYLAIRFDRDYPNQNEGAIASELEGSVSALLAISQAEAQTTLEAEMKAAELAGDDSKITELTRRFKELTSR
jgi:DNA primase